MATVNEALVGRAGAAMAWRAIQLGSVKLIFLARTLILARLLVPEDFGLLAVSLIAVDFLVSITNFGVIPALVQREAVDDHQYDVAWTVGLLRAVAIALAVIVAAPMIAALLSEPRATNLIRLIALRPMLEAAASVKVAEVTRQLRFRALGFISVPEAIVNTAVSIALAPALGVGALVAGALAGPAIASLLSYRLAPYQPRLALDAAALRPLLHFGRWIYLTSLTAVAGRALMQVVIVQKLGVEMLGLYYLAAKVAFIPAEISSEVVGAVAFPLYARLQADAHQTTRVVHTLFTSMAAILFPACTVLIVLASPLVATILGPRWQGTAPLIQLLAVVNIVGLFGDMTSPIFKGVGRPDWMTFVEVLQYSVLVLGIWSLADRYGVVSAGVAWLAAVSVSQFVSARFIQQLLPRSLSGLARPILAIAVASVAGGLVASQIAATVPGPIGVFAASGAGLMLSGVLLWAIDSYFALGLANGLYGVFPRLALLVGHLPVDR